MKKTIYFHNDSKGDGVYRRLPVRFLLVLFLVMVLVSIAGIVFITQNPNIFSNEQTNLENIQRTNAELLQIVQELELQNESIREVVENLSSTETSLQELVPEYTQNDSNTPESPIQTIDEFSLALIQSYTDTLSTFLHDVARQSGPNNEIWSSIPVSCPVDDSLSIVVSRFGDTIENFTGINKLNEGIDFAVVAGTDVRVTADGVVEKVERTNYWGRRVVVSHRNGLSTVYAHLESTSVAVGNSLNKGDIVGVVGTTRWSVGPKLHYEILKNGTAINPEILIYSEL